MKKFRILRSLDGADSAAELASLREKTAALEAENAELKRGKELEPQIREKMAAGLTREQAESVVKQQADTDKEIARLEADQAEARKKGARR